jgi:hypothetical protein
MFANNNSNKDLKSRVPKTLIQCQDIITQF